MKLETLYKKSEQNILSNITRLQVAKEVLKENYVCSGDANFCIEKIMRLIDNAIASEVNYLHQGEHE